MPKPIIGITCDYDYSNNKIQLADGYYRAISQAGGLPFLIAYTELDDIEGILDTVDGILFTGGGDVDPVYFGEMPHPQLGSINPIRDEIEIKLCRKAMDRDMPILGICRGIQVINVAMGGTLYQDLESQWDKRQLLKHSQGAPGWYGTHGVTFEEGSKIQKIMGKKSLTINSFHHQAVCKAAPGFHISGWSQDGVVEALESVQHRFAIGVQWHPERMWERDERMLLPFIALVQACGT
jgi:putative glutamine amidotransferase